MNYDKRRPDIVVFDLDGTLGCGKHRLHLLPSKEDAHVTQSWDKFNLAADADAAIFDNIKLCNALSRKFRIVILTGRCDVAKVLTKQWLYDNGVYYDKLIMRSQDDHRMDIEFKEEQLLEIAKLGDIICCFDDLEHVVKHIRSMGITAHLVTHYDVPRVDTEKRK
ncbi:polynucleotide 5' kinase [Aeromonas phage vB_AspA_Tola]|nr:polynucleotide 5' kinase [Aeromonas phage vB_AspA_Tola]